MPVDESVSVCVDAAFTFTLPNDRLEALKPSVTELVLSCRVNVCDIVPAVAVRVTDCAVEADEAVAVNVALVAPTATVTVDGTVTAELLLARLTLTALLAGATFSVTVHASVPAPVIDELAQLRPVSTGTPMPLRLTAFVLFVEELLVIWSCPVNSFAALGLNFKFRL